MFGSWFVFGVDDDDDAVSSTSLFLLESIRFSQSSAFPVSLLIGFRGLAYLSTQKHLAPSEAKSVAIALPRPPEEPVIIAILSWRRPCRGVVVVVMLSCYCIVSCYVRLCICRLELRS